MRDQVASVGDVTPETPEGRERITRLEERVESNRRQIDTFAPLVRQVERVQWHLDELAEDFKTYRIEQRDQHVLDERKRAEELQELRRNVSDQILVVTDGLKGCSKDIKGLAEAQERQWKAEADRREEERKRIEAREQAERDAANRTKTERFVAKYGLVGVLLAAIITAAATIINTLIS